MKEEPENQIDLSEICRLCLSSKTKGSIKIFSEITETQKRKFEFLTQKILPFTAEYPTNVCSECSDQLENFFFYKNQLIRKQSELCQFLKIKEDVHFEVDDYDTVQTSDKSNDEIYFQEELSEDMEYLEAENEWTNNETVNEEEILETANEEALDEEYELKSETEFAVEALSIEPALREPIKYDKIKPTLVLSADFLKARDALKNQQTEPSENVGYVAAKVISESEERIVYICTDPECKFEFSSEEEMNLHMLDHKLKSGSLQCDTCLMSFKSRSFYDKHVKSAHDNLQCVCQVCGLSFKNRIQWRSHLRNHDKTLKFKCHHEGCDKAFRVSHHLTNHLRVHSKDSPFACNFDNCAARFRQKHALTIHMRKHTGEYFYCDQCTSPFVTQFQMVKHKEKCDGTYKPLKTRSIARVREDTEISEYYKCSVAGCFEGFKAKVSLEKHLIKTHHIDVTSTMCILCCESFGTQRDLKSHLREHLPFVCSLCGTGFKNEDSYQSHLKKNHDKNENRIHHCCECTSSFKRADHLRTHIIYKHRKERPFGCDSCPYSASTKNDLNAHIKTHRKLKLFFNQH